MCIDKIKEILPTIKIKFDKKSNDGNTISGGNIINLYEGSIININTNKQSDCNDASKSKEKVRKNNNGIIMDSLIQDTSNMDGLVLEIHSKDDTWNDIHAEELTVKYTENKNQVLMEATLTNIMLNKKYRQFKYCKCGKKKPNKANVKISGTEILTHTGDKKNKFYIMGFDIPIKCIEQDKIDKIELTLIFEKTRKTNYYVFPRNYAKRIDRFILLNENGKIISCYKYDENERSYNDKEIIEGARANGLDLNYPDFSPYNVYCLEDENELK